MRKIIKLLDTLKEKFPNKIPLNQPITEKDIAFLQGEQNIINYITQYQKDLTAKEQDRK